MPNTSRKFRIIRDKEMLTTETVNKSFEAAFNSQSWGRTGVLLGIGSVTLNNNTDFTFNDVEIAAPSAFLNDPIDGSAQQLDGIYVQIGSIAKTVAIGATETITILLEKKDNGSAWFDGASTFSTGSGSPVNYTYHVRTDQDITLEYTTSAGSELVSLDAFKIKNINGTDFEILSVSDAQSTLPLFTKVQNHDYYSKVSSLSQDAVAPVSLVTGLTDNSEWEVRVFQLSLTSFEVYFNQIGSGTTEIPMIPFTVPVVTANTDYHFFLQYSYVNNVISDLSVNLYTTTDGNTSLPTDYVQQRILSFRTTNSGAVPFFSHFGNYVSINNDTEITIAENSTGTFDSLVPHTLPIGINLDITYNEIAGRDVLVTQAGSLAQIRSGREFYTDNGTLAIDNQSSGGGDRDVFISLQGYTDYTAAVLLKGLI
jgi:hypothetical protein